MWFWVTVDRQCDRSPPQNEYWGHQRTASSINSSKYGTLAAGGCLGGCRYIVLKDGVETVFKLRYFMSVAAMATWRLPSIENFSSYHHCSQSDGGYVLSTFAAPRKQPL